MCVTEKDLGIMKYMLKVASEQSNVVLTALSVGDETRTVVRSHSQVQMHYIKIMLFRSFAT